MPWLNRADLYRLQSIKDSLSSTLEVLGSSERRPIILLRSKQDPNEYHRPAIDSGTTIVFSIQSCSFPSSPLC